MSISTYIVCPECGSPDVTVDAVARWNYAAQAWELSSVMDDRTCGSCLYESPTFEIITDLQLSDSQRRYIDGHGNADYTMPENYAPVHACVPDA